PGPPQGVSRRPRGRGRQGPHRGPPQSPASRGEEVGIPRPVFSNPVGPEEKRPGPQGQQGARPDEANDSEGEAGTSPLTRHFERSYRPSAIRTVLLLAAGLGRSSG